MALTRGTRSSGAGGCGGSCWCAAQTGRRAQAPLGLVAPMSAGSIHSPAEGRRPPWAPLGRADSRPRALPAHPPVHPHLVPTSCPGLPVLCRSAHTGPDLAPQHGGAGGRRSWGPAGPGRLPSPHHGSGLAPARVGRDAGPGRARREHGAPTQPLVPRSGPSRVTGSIPHPHLFR